MPSSSASLTLLIKVSSKIKNSQSNSRRNLSSPILARSSCAHASSLSGCSTQGAKNGKKPFVPTTLSLPYSSNFLFASVHICANWSSSEFGVLVTIALPPVDSVGESAVQNSRAFSGGCTNANSSQYINESDLPRPVSSVVVVACILLPLSNSIVFLLYV